MTARDTALGMLQQWTARMECAPETPEAVLAASDAELLRDWAAKIREVGTAKGWSVWAAAFMDPDVPFVDTGMPSTETIVAELRRLDRAANLRGAADAIEREQAREEAAERGRFGQLDHQAELQGAAVRAKATFLRRLADDVEREKDTSGGDQPPAGESTPAPADLLRYAEAFEIPCPGRGLPLLLERSYAGGDRWAIGDRNGRRWERGRGFVFERSDLDERTRTDTRFPLAEAWPLAHRIAAGEPVARAAEPPEVSQ